jgi:hypothetical protein
VTVKVFWMVRSGVPSLAAIRRHACSSWTGRLKSSVTDCPTGIANGGAGVNLNPYSSNSGSSAASTIDVWYGCVLITVSS